MAIRVNNSAKKSQISINTNLFAKQEHKKPINRSQSKSPQPQFNSNLNKIAISSPYRSSRQKPKIDLKLRDNKVFNAPRKLVAPRIMRSRSASLPARSAISTLQTPSQTIIQRGEAGVHHGIEQEATGSETGLSDSNSVEEMYAGNWMRDFSQLNAPLVHQILGQIPSRIDAPQGETIGAKGAEDLATGLIRALAMLEFGPDITNQLITPENIGVYTPEQHIDNPMGTTSADHLVRDLENNNLRHGNPTQTQDKPTRGGWHRLSSDSARDSQLAGSAIPGLQVENPELYKVSDSGLTNHIYNSVEWAKGKLTNAASMGATPQGRMNMGSALHVVEDYFAHSNFIEVALNSEVQRALLAQEGGRETSDLPPTFVRAVAREDGNSPVDTLFEGQSGERQGITTGTFGSKDTKVSIAHVILPKLPELGEAINNKIDAGLGLIAQGESSWHKIEEFLAEDRSGLAVLELINAFDAHVEAPVYTGVELTYNTHSLPLIGDISLPNGIKPQKEYKGIKAAYNSYNSMYQSVHSQIERLKELRDSLPFPAFKNVINRVITTLKELLNRAIEELRQTIKGEMNQLLFSLIEEVTGLDIPEAKKRSLGDAVDWAHHAVEHMEHSTSIESRLAAGQPREVAQNQGSIAAQRSFGTDAEGNPIVPLPPSHSEISKDHPPHEMMPNHNTRWQFANVHRSIGGCDFQMRVPTLVEDNHHETSEGSLFFELHRQLAVEADKHIIAQMDRVWNGMRERNHSEEGMLTAIPTQNRENVLEEARNHQNLEAERARESGRSFATGHDSEIEGLRDLLSLVDLFISHPDDSTWWRTILSNYVNGNEAEVIAYIQARNRTRNARQ